MDHISHVWVSALFGMRDMVAVLADVGDAETAASLIREAEAFRQAIVEATAASERRETEPPFIPLALLADESPFDPLTATRLGSYYNLMAPYIIGSGVFGPGSQRETWLIDYRKSTTCTSHKAWHRLRFSVKDEPKSDQGRYSKDRP